jgi:hypothetical protein
MSENLVQLIGLSEFIEIKFGETCYRLIFNLKMDDGQGKSMIVSPDLNEAINMALAQALERRAAHVVESMVETTK